MDVSSLLAALDVLVLERLDDDEDRFVCSAPLPSWCAALPMIERDIAMHLGDVFPLLAALKDEVDAAWRADQRWSSELWTKVGLGDVEIHLEATAMNAGDRHVLLVSQNERGFAQQQLLLQRARELRLVHDQLMREFQLKDILVHTIVHDLASPLHSILGALSLLDERVVDDDSKRWIAIALHAATRQRQLVHEILDVFTAESAERSLEESSDLSRVVAQVMSEMEPVARFRLVRLETELPRDGSRVVGEEKRLFRVLTNLVDNAVRYSPGGGVVAIRARRDNGSLRVAIEDDGPGVALDLLPHMFEKLAHGGPRSGSGLGLYYCRITVESWGGGIGYEPRSEGGARFWIRLPRSPPEEVPRGEALDRR
jgi:signal transduction histidine kinase